MRKTLLIAVLALLVLAIGVNAELCYQEFANVATCGDQSAGSYNPSSVIFDGDWNTYASEGEVGFQAIYDIPTNALIGTSTFQFKDSSGIHNVTIPPECWAMGYINVWTWSSSGQTAWACRDNLENNYYFAINGGWDKYEEAIWWDIPAQDLWVYQENPDASYFYGDGYGQMFVNYTKPQGVYSNSLWQLKHSGYPEYNATIPSACWNADPNVLMFHLVSGHVGYTYQPSWVQPYCWDGSQWITAGNYYQTGNLGSCCGPPLGQDGGASTIDGNWSTYSFGLSNIWLAGPEELGNIGWDIYEEAMWWSYAEPECEPDWVCSGYESCDVDDLQHCNAVTDNNACGESYTGDFSEFTPQACDYCTPDWICDHWNSCQPDDNQYCDIAYDTNECYSQTGLPSDDYSGDFSEFGTISCDFCTPLWSCGGYEMCQPDDLQHCVQADDSFGCYGQTSLPSDQYSGDYSEFTPLTCDFCTPAWQCTVWSDCLPGDTKTCVDVGDTMECGEPYGGDYSEFGTVPCDFCVPVWECIGYSNNCEYGEAACDTVNDTMTCGEAYAGNYSEFAPEECDQSSGTSYMVDSSGNVVGVYSSGQMVTTQQPSQGTFLSLTGGQTFDLVGWLKGLWAQLVALFGGK